MSNFNPKHLFDLFLKSISNSTQSLRMDMSSETNTLVVFCHISGTIVAIVAYGNFHEKQPGSHGIKPLFQL